MANKRIELEQYKHFVNLLDEEPNRKMVRKGLLTCMIVMMIFCVGMFVLAALSNTLATNPQNIIQKPPTPSSTPSTTPSNVMPSGKAPVDTSRVEVDPVQIPLGINDSPAVAQVTTPMPVLTTPSSAPSTTPIKAPKNPLTQYTKGVGNLSNLAKGAGSRGLQIYSLVLALGLIVLLYLGIHAVRPERKAK
jgi:hypothetical protein